MLVPVGKVWHFSPRSRVCNQNFQVCKCAIQLSAHLKCAMWSIWFVHIWQTRIGARALGKILHFSSLAFKRLSLCQCDHFCYITALFSSLPHLCKYSSNNGVVCVLSGRKSCGGAHTVVSSKRAKRDSCPLYIKTGIRTQRPKVTEALPYLKPYRLETF